MNASFPPLPDLHAELVTHAIDQHMTAVGHGEAAIKRLKALHDIVGLSHELRLFSGYDSSHNILEGNDDDELISWRALHPSDAVAIADAMLNRWQRFRAIHAARVDLVPPITTDESAG